MNYYDQVTVIKLKLLYATNTFYSSNSFDTLRLIDINKTFQNTQNLKSFVKKIFFSKSYQRIKY